MDGFEEKINEKLKRFEKKAEDKIQKALSRGERDSNNDIGRSETPSSSISQKDIQRIRLEDLKISPSLRYYIQYDPDKGITPAEVKQISQFVINCPYVIRNKLYANRASGTNLLYIEENDLVNACATDDPVVEEIKPPAILIFGGLARAIGIISLAIAVRIQNSRKDKILIDVVRYVGKEMLKSKGLFSVYNAARVMKKTKLDKHIKDSEILRLSRSYMSAMLVSIIGHELGHICLCHTLGERQSGEVSRNQEREADSFASSIISTSPFSDYLVGGTVFWWILLAWVESPANKLLKDKFGKYSESFESTHPMSVDRLKDFLKANESQAKAIGLTPETIQQYLP